MSWTAASIIASSNEKGLVAADLFEVDMGQLRIVASGETTSTQANARGKLFEELMTLILRSLGYSIDDIPNRNYAGMEIDIVGTSIAAGTPLYAECKCYETEIRSKEIQAFFGKYITRWLSDARSVGLFLAIPGLNSHAKAFYEENCKNRTNMAVRLIEEQEVLDLVFASREVVSLDVIRASITKNYGIPGDWVLLFTRKGFFGSSM